MRSTDSSCKEVPCEKYSAIKQSLAKSTQLKEAVACKKYSVIKQSLVRSAQLKGAVNCEKFSAME